MATITKSIGTTARDYSTIVAWEAASYGATGSDDAIGECYNDSVFDERPLVNDSTPLSVVLTVASGERHDGTEGTGARIVRTGNGDIIRISLDGAVFKWLELDGNGNGLNNCIIRNYVSGGGATIGNMIIHAASAGGAAAGINGRDFTAFDSLVYDIASSGNTSCGMGYIGATGTLMQAYNCTVYDVSASSGGHGYIYADNTGVKWQNCISTAISGSTNVCYSLDGPSNATVDHNLADDTTASGTGSLDSKTATNQFVSIVSGSEDLHLKTGADAIAAGTDLGTTPSGVEIDIDGFDRDGGAVTWDMGAHQFIAVGGDTSITATTDALVITENQATVSLDIDIQATTAALVIAEQTTDVSLDVNITATTDALVIAEQSTAIVFDVVVTPVLDALVIAEQQATVSLDVDIQATTDALTITENQVSLSLDKEITATTQALVLTGINASVASGSDTNISATTDALVITENTATVSFDRGITATTQALVIAEQPAAVTVVSPDVEITATTQALVLTSNVVVVDFTGATDTRGGYLPPKRVKTKLKKRDEEILEQVYELVAKLEEVPKAKKLVERAKKIEVKAKKVVNLKDYTEHNKQISMMNAQIDKLSTAVTLHIKSMKNEEDAAIKALLEVI